MTETRSFYHRPDVAGLELVEATNSTGAWTVVNIRHAIAIPEEWCARVNHDGSMVDLDPTHALLLRPGEVHSTPGAERAGTVRALCLSEGVLDQYFGDHLSNPRRLDWKASCTPCSLELRHRYKDVFAALRDDSAAMPLQTALAELVALMVRQLVSKPPPRGKVSGLSLKAERMRELLHHSDGSGRITLDNLAREVGLTKFQALRAFKKRYGLPPHAYVLAARVQQAMLLLRQGGRPSDVAHELYFADHAHFTKHFKRIVGLTPRDYATTGRSRVAGNELVATRSDQRTLY